MIKFELFNRSGNSEDAVVHFPGQDYVMFNGIKIKLDRVIEANGDWVGCVFGPNNSVTFIERGEPAVMHAARMVSSTTTEMSSSTQCADEEEHRISSMRVRHAAVLLKAARRATECVGELKRLIRSFDREAEDEFGGEVAECVKLGIFDLVRSSRSAVSFEAMERTLGLVEDEGVEIIHEELDIPPLKRMRH